jgi:cell division protein FtsQ
VAAKSAPVRRGRSGENPRARVRAAVVAFPAADRLPRPELSRLAPSRRSLAVGLLVLLLGMAAYGLARSTPVFAVRTIAVDGASTEVAAEIRAALARDVGDSLVAVDTQAVERRAESVPAVAAVTIDRAFPHTLAVSVVPEIPVAVLRQGTSSWLFSKRARVMAPLALGELPGLPRVWATRDVDIELGATLSGEAAAAARAVSAVRRVRLPERVVSAWGTQQGIVLKLRSGRELRLGSDEEVRLKLAVAARVLPALGPEHRYLDVAVPDRPVAGATLKSQVDVETQESSSG